MKEDRLSIIRYYNVLFFIRTNDEKEDYMLNQFINIVKNGTKMTMNTMADWCDNHGIEYTTKFRFIGKMPIRANLWNFYSYIRFRYERKKKCG